MEVRSWWGFQQPSNFNGVPQRHTLWFETILAIESLLKMINAFYFASKALSVFKMINCGGETSPRLFSEKLKLSLFQDQ